MSFWSRSRESSPPLAICALHVPAEAEAEVLARSARACLRGGTLGSIQGALDREHAHMRDRNSRLYACALILTLNKVFSYPLLESTGRLPAVHDHAHARARILARARQRSRSRLAAAPQLVEMCADVTSGGERRTRRCALGDSRPWSCCWARRGRRCLGGWAPGRRSSVSRASRGTGDAGHALERGSHACHHLCGRSDLDAHFKVAEAAAQLWRACAWARSWLVAQPQVGRARRVRCSARWGRRAGVVPRRHSLAADGLCSPQAQVTPQDGLLVLVLLWRVLLELVLLVRVLLELQFVLEGAFLRCSPFTSLHCSRGRRALTSCRLKCPSEHPARLLPLSELRPANAGHAGPEGRLAVDVRLHSASLSARDRLLRGDRPRAWCSGRAERADAGGEGLEGGLAPEEGGEPDHLLRKVGGLAHEAREEALLPAGAHQFAWRARRPLPWSRGCVWVGARDRLRLRAVERRIAHAKVVPLPWAHRPAQQAVPAALRTPHFNV
mmetsp:Transcript_24734/g.67284  ORF Transcript_24734/g.67284 Transcript_24734/m.67284 type:complete len:498 (+) Transcript_24734:340-1833(+)